MSFFSYKLQVFIEEMFYPWNIAENFQLCNY